MYVDIGVFFLLLLCFLVFYFGFTLIFGFCIYMDFALWW